MAAIIATHETLFISLVTRKHLMETGFYWNIEIYYELHKCETHWKKVKIGSLEPRNITRCENLLNNFYLKLVS